MIKQIYIDDMTGEEITGEVYQIELSTVRGGDLDIPDDINAVRNGMHFSIDSITDILKSISGRSGELEKARERIAELEEEVEQLKQLKLEFLRNGQEDEPEQESVAVPYEPPRVIPGPPPHPEPAQADEDTGDAPETGDRYDSIKGIDEGKLKALYEAGWNNKDMAVEFSRSPKAISTKISLMVKQGKLAKRE